jgi:hypothetical protein
MKTENDPLRDGLTRVRMNVGVRMWCGYRERVSVEVEERGRMACL